MTLNDIWTERVTTLKLIKCCFRLFIKRGNTRRRKTSSPFTKWQHFSRDMTKKWEEKENFVKCKKKHCVRSDEFDLFVYMTSAVDTFSWMSFFTLSSKSFCACSSKLFEKPFKKHMKSTRQNFCDSVCFETFTKKTRILSSFKRHHNLHIIFSVMNSRWEKTLHIFLYQEIYLPQSEIWYCERNIA